MEPDLTPATPERRRAAPRLPGWFVACRAEALGDRPRAATVQGLPLVLFRGADGGAGALEDRCPHRNAPLSAGRVRDGALECAYHGWRFAPDGTCLAVPGLDGRPEARATRAAALPCVEQDGFVWVAPVGAAPVAPPRRVPHRGADGYTRGLFRTAGSRRDIDVVVRRWSDRCEAEYLGEAAPSGLVGRLLAPGGGVVRHFDRFLLPCVAEVEYRLGDRSHLVATTAVTPVDDEHACLFSAVTFRLPVPGAAVAAVLGPVARRILQQDARMLALQSDTVARFGGERFATTEADVLGPHITRLLREAERGAGAPAPDDGPPAHEHRVRMRL